jgi:hypothetical protein
MLKVVGTESTQDEVEGRSLLDEIAREGARRMLVSWWRWSPRSPRTWRHIATNTTRRATPWSSVTAKAAPGRSRSEPGRSP